MLESIPHDPVYIDAKDPLALTKVLDLPDMIVTALEQDALHERLIVFCTHAFEIALCPTCRTLSPYIHDYSKRCIRDLSWAGKSCYIEFEARRFYCEMCQCPFREELEWLPRCSRLTARYREFVFAQCQKTTLQAVHQKERLGYKTGERLYYKMAQEQARAIQPGAVRKLGIDEFAIKKGHDSFALAISDLEAGRVIAVLPEDTKQTLKGCRWLLVRNQEDLSTADKEKLEAMFAVSSSLAQLHGLKEDFRTIFETDLTPEEAAPKLEAWIATIQTSGLTKLSKFVSTLKNRWEHVLNYFRHRLTSGMVEGLNNKVKVIKRSAYGFGNFEHFALRILMECDGTA